MIRIMISPAKKMKIDTDHMACAQTPHFINESEQLLRLLQKLSYDELKALWKCNDAIAELNAERIRRMNLKYRLNLLVVYSDKWSRGRSLKRQPGPRWPEGEMVRYIAEREHICFHTTRDKVAYTLQRWVS